MSRTTSKGLKIPITWAEAARRVSKVLCRPITTPHVYNVAHGTTASAEVTRALKKALSKDWGCS